MTYYGVSGIVRSIEYKLVLPKVLVLYILKELHDAPTGG